MQSVKKPKLHLLLCHGRGGTEYCNEHVCVCLCVCVCLSARISPEPHEWRDRSSTIFLRMSSVTVARSCSGGIPIRYVFPVLWMTPRFPIMGHIAYFNIGAESDVYDFLARFVVDLLYNLFYKKFVTNWTVGVWAKCSYVNFHIISLESHWQHPTNRENLKTNSC